MDVGAVIKGKASPKASHGKEEAKATRAKDSPKGKAKERTKSPNTVPRVRPVKEVTNEAALVLTPVSVPTELGRSLSHVYNHVQGTFWKSRMDLRTHSRHPQKSSLLGKQHETHG